MIASSFQQAVVQYHQWSTMSAREVNQLQKNLTELENGLTVSDSTQQLRTELTNLNNKVYTFVYTLSQFSFKIQNGVKFTTHL